MRKTCVALFVAMITLNVFSQEGSLKLEYLTSSALERNPKIKSLGNLVEAQKFRIAPEGALPDPVLGFSFKNIGLDRFSVGKEEMSGIGFSVSQMIPFPGKLRLKADIASKQALQAEENLRASRLSLVREIKELYSRLFYYHQARELLLRKKEILKNALKIAEQKYSVGKGVQSDIFKAQVEISGIDEMILTMEQMAQISRANLNSLCDFPPENPLAAPEEIPYYELKLSMDELSQTASEKSPLLKGAELMVEESSAEVKMAKKEFYPNFMIQAGKDFRGAFKDMYEVMIGVEIPLYHKKKQANLLQESRSRLGSSRNEYASMKNEVHFMLAENFTMAKTSENLIKLYREKILPQARFALESSLASYQVDKVDFLMLLSDINSLISYEMEYFRNLSVLWASVAKLEEIASLELIK